MGYSEWIPEIETKLLRSRIIPSQKRARLTVVPPEMKCSFNTVQRLPRLTAVPRQRYAALLAVEIMRILLQGSKQAISLTLRHPQRLSPLSRAGISSKALLFQKKKEAFGSLRSIQPCVKVGPLPE